MRKSDWLAVDITLTQSNWISSIFLCGFEPISARWDYQHGAVAVIVMRFRDFVPTSHLSGAEENRSAHMEQRGISQYAKCTTARMWSRKSGIRLRPQ